MLLPSAMTCETSAYPIITPYRSPSPSLSPLSASPPLSPLLSSEYSSSSIVSSRISSQSTRSTRMSLRQTRDTARTTTSRQTRALLSTCLALQDMMNTPNQLPSPPAIPAKILPLPSKNCMELRLPSRRVARAVAEKRMSQCEASDAKMSEKRSLRPKRRTAEPCVQAQLTPPRGTNKRRRGDDESWDKVQSAPSTSWFSSSSPSQHPQTPKRLRLAPDILPVGLEAADIDHLNNASPPPPPANQPPGGDDDHAKASHVYPEIKYLQYDNKSQGEVYESWTRDQDKLLVDLVLAKIRFDIEEWRDCANVLALSSSEFGASSGASTLDRGCASRRRICGIDEEGVARRWRSLVSGGRVGLV